MGKHWDPKKGKMVNSRDIPRMFGPEGKNVRWVSAEQSAIDTRIGKAYEDKKKKQAAKAAKAAAAKAEKARKKAQKKAKAA
jgi:hypothetical protein